MKLFYLAAVLGIGFAAGYLYALSRQSGVPIVFNTQPAFYNTSPRMPPVIEMTDSETVVIHRPLGKWFTVSCLQWGDTYVRPNYSSRQCWPTRYEKLIREEDWPKVGKLKCKWEREQ